MGVRLRSLLTSSHNHRPAEATDGHGCLQETAFVSVEMARLSPSPGRRRLRFSFQINDVKDPTGGYPAPPITPGGGEERRLYPRPNRIRSADRSGGVEFDRASARALNGTDR